MRQNKAAGAPRSHEPALAWGGHWASGYILSGPAWSSAEPLGEGPCLNHRRRVLDSSQYLFGNLLKKTNP